MTTVNRALLRLCLVFACVFAASGVDVAALHAQPATAGRVRAPVDSSAAVCLDVTWLDANAICAGRAGNTASLALLGGLSGALAGYVGGALAPTACIGNGETAAARGAVAGAAAGLVGSLLIRQVSRRQLAARNAAERAAAQRTPVRGWSWRDVRPAAVVIGGAALGGAAIGTARGAQSPACTDGVGANALRGAGVYGAGALVTMGGTLLAVRWLF